MSLIPRRHRRPLAYGFAFTLAVATCRRAPTEQLPPGPPPDTTTANHPPVADAGGPYVTETGTVTLDASRSSDPDGDSLAFRWTFGDRQTAAGHVVTRVYAGEGVDTVRLDVTDARGARAATALASVTYHEPFVVFSGAGDIASCANRTAEATAALLDALPGFVFTGGDNAFPHGSAEDYANCYGPTWGRHLARTYPALGNHEYEGGNADAAFSYFGERLGTSGTGYYSADIGAWHVVVLNDNAAYAPFGAGSAQLAWLRQDLAAHPARCTMALWHVPRFLSSNTPGYTVNDARRALWESLYQAGVDVVVNGHQHHYERMAPMRPDGTRDDAGGIRQFNAGTGGASVTLPDSAIHPNSEVRGAAFGVLSFALRSGSYAWRFIPIAGETFSDSGSGTCH